jgi:hypothetical protein
MIAPTYAELRRLLAEATPGPWEGYTTACCADAGWVDGPHGPVCPVHIAPKMTHTLNAEDAALIAAMRNALPALLTEAEAGRKLRGRMDSIHAGHVWSSRETAKFALAEYDAAVAKGGAE